MDGMFPRWEPRRELFRTGEGFLIRRAATGARPALVVMADLFLAGRSPAFLWFFSPPQR